jgi:hypothetical protein
MKFSALALVFAFSPLSLGAQNTASARPSTFSVPAVSSGCPVSMQLEQRLGNQVQTVQNGTVFKAPATQLMLTVSKLLSPGASGGSGFGFAGMEGLGGGAHKSAATHDPLLRVASATATVYGFGSHPHYELLSPGPGPRKDGGAGPARNLRLRFTSKDDSSIAELWLPSFGAVHFLSLESITYADGSTWRPARGQTCTVTPSPIELVGANSAAGKTNP